MSMSTPIPVSALMDWNSWLTVQTTSFGSDWPLCLQTSRLGTAGMAQTVLWHWSPWRLLLQLPQSATNVTMTRPPLRQQRQQKLVPPPHRLGWSDWAWWAKQLAHWDGQHLVWALLGGEGCRAGHTRRCLPRRMLDSSIRWWRLTRQEQTTNNPHHLASPPFSYHLVVLLHYFL